MSQPFIIIPVPESKPGISLAASDVPAHDQPRLLVPVSGATPIFVRPGVRHRLYRRFDADGRLEYVSLEARP